MAKYLFFLMPKTGSGFMHPLLWNKLGKEIKLQGHRLLYEDNKILTRGINDPNLWRFCFVRNPYSRFISAYRYIVAPRRNKYPNDIQEKKAILKYGNLQQFCQNLEEFTSDPDNSPIHFYPQYKWITDPDGNLTMDYVGKYETMNESWQLICSHLSIDYEPIYKKQSTNILLSFTSSIFDFFNKYEDVFPLIYEFYKKDFELFGYDQEPI